MVVTSSIRVENDAMCLYNFDLITKTRQLIATVNTSLFSNVETTNANQEEKLRHQ